MPKSFCTNQIQSLQSEIDTEYQKYENLFAQLDDKDPEIEKKIDEVNSIIQLVNNRISYTEDRLAKIITFSVALMGIGMAFFAAIIMLSGVTFYIGLITAFSFFFTGGLTALVHSIYVNPKYPFRAMKNDWKWFYAGIITKDYHPKPLFQDSNSEFLSKRLLHMQGLNQYAEKVLDEGKSERLKVDLQQLYLLHVNEKYKNRYLSNLRNILFRGLLVTIIFLFMLVGLITKDRITKSQDKPDATHVIREVKPIEKPRFNSDR